MPTPVPHDDPGAVHMDAAQGGPACDASTRAAPGGRVTTDRDQLTCATCVTIARRVG